MDQNITLMAVGDIMLGDHPMCSGHGVGSNIKINGSEYIFQHVIKKFTNSDIIFGNLEAVLSNKNLNLNYPPSNHLRGKPNSVEGLSIAGFNILSLANNHAMEHGKEALDDTKNVLFKNNIYPIPQLTELNTIQIPLIITIKDIRIAFLAYCLIPDGTAYGYNNDVCNIIEDIKQAKNRCDLLILSLHWGYEYMETPSPKQVLLAHELIDSGANIILGHHPHVSQPIEIYKNNLIAYSLGNFVFDMWQVKTRTSMILEIEMCAKGIKKFEIHPILINKQYQPCILEGVCDLIPIYRESDLNNYDFNDAAYIKQASNAVRNYQKDIKLYFIKNFYRYPRRHKLFLINRYIKRRLLWLK